MIAFPTFPRPFSRTKIWSTPVFRRKSPHVLTCPRCFPRFSQVFPPSAAAGQGGWRRRRGSSSSRSSLGLVPLVAGAWKSRDFHLGKWGYPKFAVAGEFFYSGKSPSINGWLKGTPIFLETFMKTYKFRMKFSWISHEKFNTIPMKIIRTVW